jgi:protein SCO1/2
MVLKVDQPHKTFVVSCDAIPGFMEAMTMPFNVRQPADLEGIMPGMTVEFTLVVDQESSYAEHMTIRRYESVQQDPLIARQLKLLNRIANPSSSTVKALAPGQAVPDFTLLDQQRHFITLSKFAGKVVAINFIYTSCALPNFCYRITNNFGVLQKRFQEQLGRDLVLITVTFDPARDQPEVLAHYAHIWKADPANWHFLTGFVPDIRRVTNLFGVDFFPDEGLMNHSLHTAIIDRRGKLVTNIEGNQYTADQLGDLVQTVISRKIGGEPTSQPSLAQVKGVRCDPHSIITSRSTRQLLQDAESPQ